MQAENQPDYLREIKHIESSLLKYKSDRRRFRKLNEQLDILEVCLESLSQGERNEAEQEMHVVRLIL